MFAILLAGAVTAEAGTRVAVVAGSPSPLGLPFSTFSGLGLDGRDTPVFVGSSTGVFRRAGETIEGLLVAGDPLTGGGTIAGVGPPAQGPAGCFAARIFTVAGDDRVLRSCPSGVHELARSGDSAPGGGHFVAFDESVAMGIGGHVAFVATLDDATVGVFRWEPTDMVSIARSGGPSPAGGTISGLRVTGVTQAGRVGVRLAVTAGADGFAVGDGGVLEMILARGQASPAGGQFSEVGNGTLNADDQWAFRGEISDGNRAGIFRIDARTVVPLVTAVALRDDPAPAKDATFRTFASSLVPAIGDDGSIAFRASLAGADLGAGIFFAPVDGPITKVAGSREPTAEGSLVRFRDPSLAGDGSVSFVAVAATTENPAHSGAPAIFVHRLGVVDRLATLGDETDVPVAAAAFRFGDPSPRDVAGDAVFQGVLDGVFAVEPDGSVRTIAALGRVTPVDGTYASFGPVSVGDTGVISFVAEVQGGRAAEAVVRIDPSGLAQSVAATADRAPKGGIFANFVSALVTVGGGPDVGGRRVAFEGLVDNTSAASGIYVGQGKRMRAIAREGGKAPGGEVYTAFGDPALGAGANVAYAADISNGETGVFFRNASKGRRIVRTGETARTRLAGRFTRFDHIELDRNRVVFRGTTNENGGQGIFVGRGARLGAVATSEDLAPAGIRFRSFNDLSAASGTVAFLGRLAGASVDGLYLTSTLDVPTEPDDPAPPVTPLLLPGEAAPMGGTIRSVVAPSVSANGGIAAIVTATGGTATSGVVVITAE